MIVQVAKLKGFKLYCLIQENISGKMHWQAFVKVQDTSEIFIEVI